MKGKNGQKWSQKSAFVVRESKVGAFAAFKHIHYCRFSCQVGFCDSFRLWNGPGLGCSWFHLSCEKGCTTGWRGQTKAPSGVVSLKNRTQCSSFTIFIAFSGMNFRSAPSFGSPVPLGVVVCGWGFWASEKMTWLFRSPTEASWSARIPKQNSKRGFYTRFVAIFNVSGSPRVKNRG